MIFEFRNYSYYRGDHNIGDFKCGYVQANSVDQAIGKLFREFLYDDSLVGNYVREAPNVVFPSDVNIAITGEYSTCYKDLPYWALTSPKDWEKEGFSSGTPRIRVM